jgi:hypothetical protein
VMVSSASAEKWESYLAACVMWNGRESPPVHPATTETREGQGMRPRCAVMSANSIPINRYFLRLAIRLRTVRNSMTIGKPFKKGQSGNPGGRPKVVAEVRELARAHTNEAVQTLASIMTNPKSAPAARVSAANALLDRGYGKPPQHITGEGGPSYVVRLPEPCKTTEEWEASLQFTPPANVSKLNVSTS